MIHSARFDSFQSKASRASSEEAPETSSAAASRPATPPRVDSHESMDVGSDQPLTVSSESVSRNSSDTVSKDSEDSIKQPRPCFLRRCWNGLVGFFFRRNLNQEPAERELNPLVELEHAEMKEEPAKEVNFKEKFLEKLPAEIKERVVKKEELLEKILLQAEKRYNHIKSSKNRIYKNLNPEQLEVIAMNEAVRVAIPLKKKSK